MAKEKWLTKEAFREWMKEEKGVEISRQRLFNWIKRKQIKTRKVYGGIVLVDKTSVKVDLGWGKNEEDTEI